MLAERVGEVSEIMAPQGGKKSGSAKVGGRKIWFFWSQYQSESPSLIRQFLEDAQANGVRVEVSGDEFQGEGPNGPYTSFSAKDVRAASQTSENGSQAPQTASQGRSDSQPEHKYVGRVPGEADYWLAMRWAYSMAVDILGRGDEPPSVDQITKLAGELFSRSRIQALEAQEEQASIPGKETSENPF